MRILTFILAIVWVLGASSQSQFDIGEFYPAEQSHSFVAFSVTYMGYAKVRGNFEEFDCSFRYDPEDITKTSVTFSVKTASIDSDLEWRDNDLKSANWLDVEQFPEITFSSTRIIPGDEGFQVVGDLTIKAVTKEVTIDMDPPSGVLKDVRGDKMVIFSGSHTLDRTEYGVEGKRWSQVKEGIAGVASDVTIEFSMLGKQLQIDNLTGFVRNEERPPGRLHAAYKSDGVENAFTEFEKLKGETEVNEFALGTVGMLLLRSGETQDAIAILAKNAEEFPDKTAVLNALAEAHATAGDLESAKQQYLKTMEIEEGNAHAKEVLRYLQ